MGAVEKIVSWCFKPSSPYYPHCIQPSPTLPCHVRVYGAFGDVLFTSNLYLAAQTRTVHVDSENSLSFACFAFAALTCAETPKMMAGSPDTRASNCTQTRS